MHRGLKSVLMHRKLIGLTPISTNWIYTFQLHLALVQVIPWHWQASRPWEVESRKKTWGRDDRKNSKPVSTPNASAEQKQMRTKGGANGNFMPTCNMNYFFQLKCLTNFEIGWTTTNVRIAENVAKERKHHYVIFSERHLITSNLFILRTERTVDVCFDFQKHHSDKHVKFPTALNWVQAQAGQCYKFLWSSPL